ncbi:MAG: DNA polymerase III subunit gamma/tau, partial [Cyanobacteria bacterium]|nr:DNA polymerase III subunit gamma/tau [Cyanobacteriota bacterium]
MAYEPLHHKYRPQTFTELVGQDAIATTLTSALEQRRIAPAYLFCGPRGTGKTSSARILAKSLNCLSAPDPTAQPCGQCDVCTGINNGSVLDIVEIDAASNTGVDNIRELIERAQFAPVQCRYKVYVIDECLTGDAQVLTQKGLMRIDDPQIQGQQVLSYDDKLGAWEFKPVLRWLDQGTRDILEIQTTHRKIRCTGNHLIRTEQGWVAAKDIKTGVKILSPAPVAAGRSSTKLAPIDARAALLEVTSSRATPTVKSLTASTISLRKQSRFDPAASVDAAKSWVSRSFCNKREKGSAAFSPTGKGTPSRRATAIGSSEPRNTWMPLAPSPLNTSALSTARSWETGQSLIPTPTVDFPDWPGPTASNSKTGWSTKPPASAPCNPNYGRLPTKDMESPRCAVVPLATPISEPFSVASDQTTDKSPSPTNGYPKFPRKAWPGGTWMTAPSALAPKEAPKSNSIQKGFLSRKTSSLLTGSPPWAIRPRQNPTLAPRASSTPTSPWELMPPETGSRPCNDMPFPPWTTNLEAVVSVRPAGAEPVYDIEVADNHNFVANGLLVHNCHMLSTAAFNALLKTLEEPPDQVIFVLATTDPQRVLPTIISRCQRFDFRRIPLEAMVSHLQFIVEKETIDITPEAVRLVAQVAQGGLRDAESLLDQLSLLVPPVTVEKVWDLVGAVPEQDLLALTEAIATNDSVTVLDQARKLMDRGREPLIVLQNLAGFYRDLLIAKTAASRGDLVAVTPPTWAAMQSFGQSIEISTLLAGQTRLREAEVQIKNTTQPRLWLEVTLLSLLPAGLASAAPSQVVTHAAPSPRAATPIPNPTAPPTPSN